MNSRVQTVSLAIACVVAGCVDYSGDESSASLNRGKDIQLDAFDLLQVSDIKSITWTVRTPDGSFEALEDPGSRLLVYEPSQSGLHLIEVTALLPSSRIAHTLALDVVEAVPTVALLGPDPAYPGEPYWGYLSARDTNGDTLTYSVLLRSPDGSSADILYDDETDEYGFTPTVLGAYQVTAEVSDGIFTIVKSVTVESVPR